MVDPEAQPRWIDPSRIYLDLSAGSREELYAEICRRLEEAGAVRDGAALARRFRERDRHATPALTEDVLLPHLRVAGLPEPVLAVGLCARGVPAAEGRRPVRLALVLLSPEESPAAHLAALARLSRMLKNPGVIDALMGASSAEAAAALLRRSEGQVAGR